MISACLSSVSSNHHRANLRYPLRLSSYPNLIDVFTRSTWYYCIINTCQTPSRISSFCLVFIYQLRFRSCIVLTVMIFIFQRRVEGRYIYVSRHPPKLRTKNKTETTRQTGAKQIRTRSDLWTKQSVRSFLSRVSHFFYNSSFKHWPDILQNKYELTKWFRKTRQIAL